MHFVQGTRLPLESDVAVATPACAVASSPVEILRRDAGGVAAHGAFHADRSGRIRVTIAAPTSLAHPGTGVAEAFERLWRRLPEFEGNNASCFLDEDGGTFLKGQRLRVRGGAATLLQAGRLAREVRTLAALRSSGLPVPEIVLHGVETRLGVPVRALLVLRRLQAARSLRDELRATQPNERADLWEPLGGVVARMHAAGIFHRDLTARNILVQRQGGPPRIHLIDCPRGAVAPPAARRGFLRRADLFRLGRSILHDGGTEREVRRVVQACGFGDPDRLIEMVRRSLDAGGARPLRTKIWVGFGV